MKIVILSRNFFPLNAPRATRATELAKELSRQGHDVTVYALLGRYDYSNFESKFNIIVKNFGTTIFGNQNSDGQVRNSFLFRLIRRAIGPLIAFPEIEMLPMVYRAIKKERQIDLVITIAIPFVLHWGTALAKSRAANELFKCWIADCGDPYMGNPLHKHPFYFKYVEKWWSKKADYITIPIEEARSAYYSEFHDKIRVIPQGFDYSNIKLSEYRRNDIPHFAYAGYIYKGFRDPTAFLDYLCSLENLDFRFIVYTKSKDIFLKYQARLGRKLELRDYVPREELLLQLSKMDFLINIKNNSSVQQASKLIDYHLAKQPILEIDSAFADAQVFSAFLIGDYSNKHEALNLSQYDIRTVAEQFTRLCVSKLQP